MKKHAKRLLLFLHICALFILTACSVEKEPVSGNDATILGNYSADELATHHEVMMILYHSNGGEEWCRLGGSQVNSAIYPMLKTYIPEYEVPPLYP